MPRLDQTRGSIALALFLALASAAEVSAAEAVKAMYSHDWHVLGPFPNEDGKALTTVYPPEKSIELEGWHTGIDNASLRWRRILGPSEPPSRSGPVNLRDVVGAKASACAYAFATIRSERERSVLLCLGADGSVAAWVNGKPMLSDKGPRPI